MKYLRAIAFLLFTLCYGCTSVDSIFQKDGFHHTLYPYHVSTNPDGNLMPSGWKLDNYTLNANGAPKKVKKGPDYEITLDLSDSSWTFGLPPKYPLYDLSYINLIDNGEIWLRTIPLPMDMEKTKLRVMMKRAVETIAGEGVRVNQIDSTTLQGKSIRFATKIISSKPMRICGYEAYSAIIEIANVDQLKLSPESRWNRLELVLIRTNYLWETNAVSTKYYPVLMMACYSNLPEDFELRQDDFHNFLNRITITDYPEPPKDVSEKVFACVPDMDEIRLISKTAKIDHRDPVSSYEKQASLYSPDLKKYQLDCINEQSFTVPVGKIYLSRKKGSAKARRASVGTKEDKTTMIEKKETFLEN